MPAYFSIDISIKKSSLYEGIYADFIGILQREGLFFFSGYLEFMDEPLEQIIAWNEEKLKTDYEPGPGEHYSVGYRQICLDYHGFSEVRSYILNRKAQDEVVFSIIIPEDELLKYEGGKLTYAPSIISDIRGLICRLWEWECVGAIQTTLELSGDSCSLLELEEGKKPSVEPFAIVPRAYVDYDFGKQFSVTEVERAGVMIEALMN